MLIRAGQTVSVARYPDTPTPMVLRYFARRALGGKELRYYRHRQLPRDGVDWYVVNIQLGGQEPSPRLRLGGNVYEVRAKFGNSAPAGLTWWIFARL